MENPTKFKCHDDALNAVCLCLADAKKNGFVQGRLFWADEKFVIVARRTMYLPKACLFKFTRVMFAEGLSPQEWTKLSEAIEFLVEVKS